MDYELMMNGNVKIGQHAPNFSAETTYGPINLEDYKGKWLVFFSHPRRFYPRKVIIFGWINKMPDIAYNFDIDKVYQILLLSSTKAIGKKNKYWKNLKEYGYHMKY